MITSKTGLKIVVAVLSLFFYCGVVFAEKQDPEAAPASGHEANLSLEVVDVEIMDILKIISKKSGLNVVAGKDIHGQVSIFLKDVPVREALKTILQSQGLAYYEEDNIFKVILEREYEERFGRPFGDVRLNRDFRLKFASADDLAATLNLMKSPTGKIVVDPRSNTIVVTDTAQVLHEMEGVIYRSDKPLETRAIQIKYAKIEDIEEKVKDLLKNDKTQWSADKRSGKIFITDIPSRVEKVSAMINAFDVKVPEVLIEAKVVEVRLADNYRLGINWNSVFDIDPPPELNH